MLNAFEFCAETKPKATIELLHTFLSPFGLPFTLQASRKMLLSTHKDDAFIILISHGCFSMNYIRNDLHIFTAFAPNVVGLVDGYGIYYSAPIIPQHYIRAETDCEGWRIPLAMFVEQCEKHSLWHDVAKLLAQRLLVMSVASHEPKGLGAYGKIRGLLIELSLYPDDIKRHITVSTFIKNRTQISRSRIMSILSELKKGCFLETKSGSLVSIKNLPRKF